MTGQVQKEHTAHKKDEPTPTGGDGAAARERAASVSSDTADLLGDIDELLNELPQDLATSYVQHGGQ